LALIKAFFLASDTALALLDEDLGFLAGVTFGAFLPWVLTGVVALLVGLALPLLAKEDLALLEGKLGADFEIGLPFFLTGLAVALTAGVVAFLGVDLDKGLTFEALFLIFTLFEEILGVSFLACLGLVFTLILAPELESLGDFLEVDLLIFDLSG